jgi:hypothetical protein
MYNKAANVTQKDGTTPSTMIRAIALTPEHMEIVKSFIEFNGGNPLFTLKQLWAANQALRNRKYAPYFIAKNLACKTKVFGQYDLSKLKVAASKAASKTVKKEDAPKRNRKAKKETPVEPATAEATA